MTELTEHEILKRLILHARRQTAALRFNRFDAKVKDFLRVTTELLLATLAHAEAVDLLLDRGHVTATAALERAAWELSAEFEFLVRRDEAIRDATRARIHALLDVHEHAETAFGASSALRNDVAREITGYEKNEPELVADMRALRKKNKRSHWSGVSRTEVYAHDAASRSVYKLLSWEAHPIAVGIHAIEVSPDGDGVRVGIPPVNDVGDLTNRVAWAVAHSLFFVWNGYAAIWRLQAVESPWDNSRSPA